MSKHRTHLPQMDGGIFLTDSGLETTLVFHDGYDLPEFAAFDIARTAEGMARLKNYFRRHAGIAKRDGAGFILESYTWRASRDWGAKIGYSETALAVANTEAIELLAAVRGEFEGAGMPMVISGCIGPRDDGYDPAHIMSAAKAEAYHQAQIDTFAATQADLVSAVTMTNIPEAIGIARAAVKAGMPVIISFTVETDGRLPTGEALGEAIEAVDRSTASAPAYYMINCAHPTHFAEILPGDEQWTRRLGGIRANASTCSHAELDAATELDDGDPEELGRQYRDLRARFPHINVLGGCCGTDHRHVEQISHHCSLAA